MALKTFAERDCFSSVDDLLTSSTTIFAILSFTVATTWAIKSTSSFDADAFCTASIDNISIWSAFVSANDSNFSGLFSEKSAITLSESVESSLIFFFVIFVITAVTVPSSDFAITLLNISADLSVSWATIVSNIFSFTATTSSEVEEVIKVFSLSDKLSTTFSIRSSFTSIIFVIVSPIFFSSDWSKTFDKKSVLSDSLFSTIKSKFAFFSFFIFSLTTSISFIFIIPSLFASSNFPSWSFFWSFWSNSFSSILDTLTKVWSTDFNSSFSSEVCSLLDSSFSWLTSTTCSGLFKFVLSPSEFKDISPTFPKLSSANATFDEPSAAILTFSLVPLTPNWMCNKSTNISPLLFLAMDPDSMTISPFLTSALNFCLAPDFSNSLTFNDVSSFKIIVVLSLYWTVKLDWSETKISSFKNIGSNILSSLSSPSKLIVIAYPSIAVIDPILSSA